MDMKKQDDKESVASLDESIKCITTYDVPKTSNNQQKQQPVCITYIVGNFLHFWSLARHKTKFQITCETCKTARLEEFYNFFCYF